MDADAIFGFLICLGSNRALYTDVGTAEGDDLDERRSLLEGVKAVRSGGEEGEVDRLLGSSSVTDRSLAAGDEASLGGR